jgi:Xaa-Pro aminopeptidase
MSELAVSQEEYEARWQAVRDACAERDLDGLVVWSRGGATVDGFADVFYLSHHYTPFALAEDIPPTWSGRAHAAAFIPTEGDPVLFVDEFDWRRDLVAIEDVRASLNVPLLAGEVITANGYGRSRLGFAGRNAMILGTYQLFRESLPDAELVDAEYVVPTIRMIKSPAEQDRIRRSGKVGAALVSALMEVAMEPGRTEADAVEAAYSVAVQEGVAVYDIVVSSGPNSHCYAYSKFPSWSSRVLEAGDLLHVDTYGAVDGYLYDIARTCVVGGEPTPEQREMLEAAVGSVNVMRDAIEPGITGGALYAVCRDYLSEHELHDDVEDEKIVSAVGIDFPAFGHGLGLSWERPWFTVDDRSELVPNMCISLESHAGSPGIGSALFEQNLLITDDGVEMLNADCAEQWWS